MYIFVKGMAITTVNQKSTFKLENSKVGPLPENHMEKKKEKL